MLLDIVKKIVSEKGEQILSDPKRVNAFFSDLAREEPKPQKQAFIKSLEHGFAKILKNVAKEERTNCKESLAKRLRSEEGFDIELCREAIDIICEVLFGEKPEHIEGISKFCFNCGKPILVAVNFCGNCGANLKNIYFTDPRDGKKYKAVKIGDQIWMAKNLNYNAEGSLCYDNDPKNAEKYGMLYDWETAMKVCPKGWHLPTNEEWDKLYRFADSTSGYESPYDSETAGEHLKAKSGWNEKGNGLDTYSFAALPGGYGGSVGSFLNVGNYGNWWSASENTASYAYYRYMYYNYENAYYNYFNKSYLFSVRCLQDVRQ